MIIAVDTIQEARTTLESYIEREKFKGYDPYDTLTSPLPFQLVGKWGPILAIQAQKRNPLSLRPLLRIKKEHNPKAMGLLLNAYSLQYLNSPSEALRTQMDFLFGWLIDNPTKGFSGYCWGYNFDWASPKKYLKAYSPTIVVSGFIAQGIARYYQATKEEKALDVLKSIGDFVLNDLEITEDSSGICFSYSTIERDCCYNASLLGAELLALLYRETKNEMYRTKAILAADFVTSRQHQDGHWNYSLDAKTGTERKQIDFHQGYVLDSLAAIDNYLGTDKYNKVIQKGLDYYKREQFNAEGRSLWRVPAVWPVDIHNQAQGIITLSRASTDAPDNLEFALKIADWTLAHMRSEKGFFYYKKYPLYKIKTSFMRWGQAWMLLALTELLTAHEEISNHRAFA